MVSYEVLDEIFDTVASLAGSVHPCLGPLATIIKQIMKIVRQSKENQKQSTYLLKRCTDLYLHVKCLTEESRGGAMQQYAQPLSELQSTLEHIQQMLERISRYGRFDRLLRRRHQISGSIAESHASLGRCMELFNLKMTTTLASVALEIETARQQDQEQVEKILEQLLSDNANILQTLELHHDQTLDAIHSIVPVELDDHIRDQLSRIETLLARQLNRPVPAPSGSWSVSRSEVAIDYQRIVGSGGFGTVYEGEWSGTRVAVKIVTIGTPQEVLTREINIWRQVHHPHIASFFRACLKDSPPLLLSELYKSGDVIKFLSGERGHTANRIQLCHEIALGMLFLHFRDIVHGDLKPSNVLIDDAGCARITDFGLSKVKSFMTTRTGANLQQVQRIISGTRAFMSPERLRGGRMDFPMDVYAFGMTMYQILTDEAPFQNIPEEDIRDVVVRDKERPDRPQQIQFTARGLTDGAWGLIETSWAQEKTARPKFTEIAARLRPLIVCGKIKLPPIPNLCLAQDSPESGSRISRTRSQLLSLPTPPAEPSEAAEYIVTIASQVYTSVSPYEVIKRYRKARTTALSRFFQGSSDDRFRAVIHVDGGVVENNLNWKLGASESVLVCPDGICNIILRKSSKIHISLYCLVYENSAVKETIPLASASISGNDFISLAKSGRKRVLTTEITTLDRTGRGESCSTLWFILHPRPLDDFCKDFPESNPQQEGEHIIYIRLNGISKLRKRSFFSSQPNPYVILKLDGEVECQISNQVKDSVNPVFQRGADRGKMIIGSELSVIVFEVRNQNKPPEGEKGFYGAITRSKKRLISAAREGEKTEAESLERLGSECGILSYTISYRVPLGWKICKTPGQQEYYVRGKVTTWKLPTNDI